MNYKMIVILRLHLTEKKMYDGYVYTTTKNPVVGIRSLSSLILYAPLHHSCKLFDWPNHSCAPWWSRSREVECLINNFTAGEHDCITARLHDCKTNGPLQSTGYRFTLMEGKELTLHEVHFAWRLWKSHVHLPEIIINFCYIHMQWFFVISGKLNWKRCCYVFIFICLNTLFSKSYDMCYMHSACKIEKEL